MSAEPDVSGAFMARRHVLGVAGAAALSGAAAYGSLLVAALVLDADENARFLYFWGAAFSLFAVVIGLQSEITRSVRSAELGSRSGGRVAVPALVVAGLVSLLGGITLATFGGGPVGDDATGLSIALVIATVTFTGHALVTGVLSARREWTWYASLVGLEGMVRLVLVSIAAAVVGRVVGIAVAAACASGVWVVVALFARTPRRTLASRGDAAAFEILRRCVVTMASAGASGLLVVGFPLLLGLVVDDGDYASAAPLLLAVMLTRAPIMLPLGAFQSVFVSKLTGTTAGSLPGVRVLTGMLVVSTAFVAVVAGLGPPVLRLLGTDYSVGAAAFGGLAFGAIAIAAATVTGAACIAADRHVIGLFGWIAALVTATAVLASSGHLDARIVGALVAGPVAAIAVHITALRRGGVRAAPAPSRYDCDAPTS